MKRSAITLIIGMISTLVVQAQGDNLAKIIGQISDVSSGERIEFVTIYVKNQNFVTESNNRGNYDLDVPADEEFTLVFTRIGYKEVSRAMGPLLKSSTSKVDVQLATEDSDFEVLVTESRVEEQGMIREGVEVFKLIPSTSGNFESILPHIALGTSSGTGGELSSQYNVRGGNYDENLVYVNDFEIFRPQLLRNSQQEGLSFPNIDLIRDLSFSSGGFEAKYGDKMSSVLDIRYKRPDEFRASVGFSLLGASAHLEGSKQLGAEPYNRLRYLVGARYKTSRYLLGTLDVKGEYTPNFTDIQSYVSYDISRDVQVGLIANFNQSQYDFFPKEQATALGLINLAIRLNTLFEGSEVDRFTNGMTGLSLTYLPEREENPLFLKFLASNYLSEEKETFDILGFYRLSQIESDFGSEDFGEEVSLLGSGTQHAFARNNLSYRISNAQHKGGIELQMEHEDESKTSSHFLQWSLKFQNESFDDRLNEWERLDSAGYSLPFDENEVRLFNVLKSNNNVLSNRLSAYIQDSYTFRQEDRKELKLSLGVRAAYWDLNKETIISPRALLLFKPLSWKSDISFKLAGGLYYQPPIYRELRRPDGTLNHDLKSQKSLHFVTGMTYDFLWKSVSDKKFRLIAEAYYKKLDNLISYEIENVRIRYSGENDSEGYVAGIDLRLNGEFVPGAESWFNLSFLQARERIHGVEHLSTQIGDTTATQVSYVPRPTDQFFTMSIFFQDYLPRNENFKMNLNLFYGSGLPFGVKENNVVFRNPFRYKAYQRVDLGFSWLLWSRDWRKESTNNPFRFSRNVWMSLEVFNLIGIENVASNTWIKTIFESQYAIPNNLTSRRINLKFKIDL